MRSDRPDKTSFTNLRFLCVATGQPIDYEVPGDAQTLKDLWSRTLLRSCRHCGQVHRVAFRSAYVAGVLADREPGFLQQSSVSASGSAPRIPSDDR
jgi:hypothetical protein